MMMFGKEARGFMPALAIERFIAPERVEHTALGYEKANSREHPIRCASNQCYCFYKLFW